ncbi:PKD domain-containing protein, partial [Halorubrum sp. SD683]|uniref:PKD domain-containing protein n=1 Tax=Halorubrum sp. SD683 TaxID=1855873 RepID=UPI000A2DE6B8
MRDRRVLLLVALVVLAPIGGAVVVSAAPVENDSYAVAQGTNCYPIDPVTNESQTAFDFYDYRNPDTVDNGNENSSTYSSFGTREYQETATSALFFYEGSERGNLVLVHDELGDGDGGSTLTMAFEGLPADGEWVVEDDEYPDRDDDWNTGETTADIDWKWGENRTDGGVYSGLGNMSGTITIEPGFNEEAAHWGDWGHSGNGFRVDEWRLIDADGSETTLDRDRQVFVHGGGCVETPPSAALTGPNSTETGETVTLDAGGTTDDGEIGGYEWDLDGDGEIDEVTTESTIDHAFDEAGERAVEVTAFDTYGNGDTAELTVTVTQQSTPPNASLAVPDVATVNESIVLDASGSTDEGTITSYQWDVDGDGTAEVETREPTLEHTYTEIGTVAPAVAVTDDDGQTDAATATVSVRPPDRPPNASLDAPANATVGEPATFDASNSTDDRGIDAYRWDFDGDGEVEDETAEPTVAYEYETGGTFDATVTVVDTGGNTATASASVTVTVPPSPPSATLDAPAEATVNETITLDASDSSDEGTIVEYRWDLDGDGTIETNTTAPTIDHVYTELGEVEPAVTVVDDDNETATDSAGIAVVAPNDPPNASLDAPEAATVNESVVLDASGSTDADGIDGYRWDLDGDGEIDEESETPTLDHTFTDAGRVTVGVTVVGTDGQTATATATVAVGDPDAATAVIDVGTAEPTAGDPVAFDAGDASAASEIVGYEWAFGDGASATGASVEHTYADAGEYDVTLTITTAGGVSANATTTVSVAENEGGDGGDGSDGGNDRGDGNDGDGNDGGDGNNGGGQAGGGGG